MPIPRKISNKFNPLYQLNKGKQLDFEVTLADTIHEKTTTVSTCIAVVRSTSYSSKGIGFLGGKYLELNPRDAELMFQFIHAAQTYEIRKILRD